MAALRRKLFAVALLAACAAPAAQEEKQEQDQLPIQVEARSSDFDYQNGVLKFDAVTITQGQVRITAESAVASGLDFKESSWEFSGTVRISMPESALASESARVKFAGGEISSAAVSGRPATFEQKRKDQQAQGRANRIDYDLKRGTVEFTGEAWLSDGKREITGEKLTYSTTNQRVVSGDPVVITIQPGATAPESPKPDP